MLEQSLDGVEALLLVGGPAGCGKTTIAQTIVDAPGQFELPASCPLPFHRTDWKSLEAKHFREGTVIVEFATNKLNDPVQLQKISDFIDGLQKAAPIMGTYVSVIDRKTLLRRYFQRMTAWHFLHAGKWKSLSRYLLAGGSDDFGIAAWNRLLDSKSLARQAWPISRRAGRVQ
uniref:hypothetical protein n=1 Tax=Pararhizobium sp. IMCC3301 TaxID=3067904 RepID=UPI00274199A6|nr:hypothetical protein [Pararhizobium sp. IMCC3301]